MTRAEKKAAKANGAAATPAPAETPSGTVAPGGGNGQVWVNTKTHKYHKEGSHFYGRTKEGKYMSEQDAIAEGDHDHEGSHEKAAGTPKPQ